jgi:hypothetical protein
VSFPFTTSRARTRSAPSCLTFDPVTTISSPLLKPTPISSRKTLGTGSRQRVLSHFSPASGQSPSRFPSGATSLPLPPPSSSSRCAGRIWEHSCRFPALFARSPVTGRRVREMQLERAVSRNCSVGQTQVKHAWLLLPRSRRSRGQSGARGRGESPGSRSPYRLGRMKPAT